MQHHLVPDDVRDDARPEEQREITHVLDEAIGLRQFRPLVEDDRQRDRQSRDEHCPVPPCRNRRSPDRRQQDVANDLVLERPQRGIDEIGNRVVREQARQRRHAGDQQAGLDDVAWRRRIIEIVRNRQSRQRRADHQCRQQDTHQECWKNSQSPRHRIVAHTAARHQALHDQNARHDEKHLHAVLPERIAGPADKRFRSHRPGRQIVAMRDEHRECHGQPHQAEAVAILGEHVAEARRGLQKRWETGLSWHPMRKRGFGLPTWCMSHASAAVSEWDVCSLSSPRSSPVKCPLRAMPVQA